MVRLSFNDPAACDASPGACHRWPIDLDGAEGSFGEDSSMSLTDRLGSIYDTFSRRKRSRGKGFPPDVLDANTRNRVLLLLRDVYAGIWNADRSQGNYSEEFWNQIHNILEHLYGRPKLSNDPRARNAWEDGLSFARTCEPAEFFDFLEAIFKAECTWRVVFERNQLVDAINVILRSDNAPYQLTPAVTREERSSGSYDRGTSIVTVALPKVVRVDDEAVHTEAVLPALSVLTDPAYAGANDEFRKALADYRQGDFEDCLVKAGSAFESVLKVVCQKNGIAFDPDKDTAGPLLGKVLSNSTLDAGTFKEPLIAISRMRNRLSAAHGGGSKVKAVERHVAQYAMTSTAAAIVLLVHDMGK
jgi:hypothetical protein